MLIALALNLSQLEHQDLRDSRWIFVEITSMCIKFHKTDENNRSRCVKFSFRSTATLNFENTDNNSVWYKLAFLHRCENGRPKKIKN